MAYKLDKTGRYVDSSGKKYDAASGWSASKDGKTLTNSYTGQTVTDAGSTTKSNALASTATTEKTASSSRKTSPRQVTYTSGSKSTGSSANTNTAVSNANTAIANTPQVNRAVTPKTTTTPTAPAQQPLADYNVGAPTDQASALAMMKIGSDWWGKGQNDWERDFYARANQEIADKWFPGAERIDGEWYYNGSPLYGQDFTGSTYQPQGATKTLPIDDYISNPALKGILSQNAAPDHIGGVFLELGDMGKSQPQMAYSLDGSQYEINTAKGLAFLHDAKPGESIVGSDGARLTKNEDGSMTVYKDGKTYIYGAGMMTGIYPDEFEYTPFDQTEVGQTLMQDYQQLMDKIQNYDPFTYDPNTDPLYLQYADSYTRGGQRAMTDILGQLAARTGGMASSYAGSMAQQAYDQYMADLAAKIPELQQLAYSMYMDRYNRDVGNYDRAYTQFADAYNRYGQDTQFRYNQYQDDIANRWKNMLNTQDMYRQGREEYNASNQWDAQQKQQAYLNQREEEQTAWDRQQAEQDRADRRAELDYNRRQDTINNLWDQVNRYGRIPQLNTVLAAGLTYQDYEDMVEQAKHVRAADASRYYSGW